MKIEYTGRVPRVYRRIGGLVPGQVIDIPDELARLLLIQDEFKPVSEAAATKKTAPRGKE